MMLPKSTFKFIYHFVREQWIKFSIFAIISIIWAVNDIFFPYFIKKIVDILQNYQGVRADIYSALQGTIILLLLFWAISEICQRTQGILQIYTFPRFRASMRTAVFNYVQLHSHEYFSSHFAGNIAKKLGDLPNSCQVIMEIICFQFITAFVGSILIIIMMWSVLPLFAIIVLVWLMAHLVLTLVFLRYGNQLWIQHSDTVSALSGKITDSFTNILNVRLFAQDHHESNYLKKYQFKEMKKAKKAMWFMEFTRIGLGLNGLFLIFAIIFGLLYGWVKAWVTIGDFTQVSMQAFWLLGFIWYVSYQMTVFIREVGTVANALSLVNREHDLVDKPNAGPLLVSKGEISFAQVSFGYQKKRPIFHNLSVTVPAGQKLGLVGFSGSGKSTFVNLILRFYDVTSGRILIDGQNIADVQQHSLRAQIAMIPQEPGLFHRTLMENIRYGRLSATDEEVIAAATLAHCHEFIEKIDEGYQALVGERGIKLSGGQRQRVAIARAILKNAPIFILDEATSSLDSVTEKLIRDSLQKLMQGRTTIVVAHRLSTLADMDRILVFDKGKIVEDGTKDDLLKAGGHFSYLWNMQSDGFLLDIEDENE